jgi:hypothetical protein
MEWRLIAAIVVAGLLSTLTDWLFMGVLFKERYLKYPETWWPQVSKGNERGPIVFSSALAFVTAAAVVMLCFYAGVHGLKGALIVAGLAAAAGPLVISPTNGLWVRIDPAVTFAHTVGYIVRFLLAGIAAGIALS